MLALFYFYFLLYKIEFLLYPNLNVYMCEVVNPKLENECELKRFKACAVYPRVWPFWIYTTVSFFNKPFSPLPVCVLKILCILKQKKSVYICEARF